MVTSFVRQRDGVVLEHALWMHQGTRHKTSQTSALSNAHHRSNTHSNHNNNAYTNAFNGMNNHTKNTAHQGTVPTSPATAEGVSLYLVPLSERCRILRTRIVPRLRTRELEKEAAASGGKGLTAPSRKTSNHQNHEG